MNRRLTLLSGALLATLALSSCGTATGDDYVAKVGDATLTRDELDALTNSSTDGNAMRIAITNWVQVTAIGGDTSDISSLDGLVAAGRQALDELAVGFADEARALYELGLDGSPVLCLRVIPLAEPALADEVLAQLEAGLTFVEAVAEFSVDPGMVESGGLVTDSAGAECLAPGGLNEELLASLAAAEAAPGVPVSIVFTDRPLIVLMRPFDDLAQSDRSALASTSVNEAANTLLSEVTPTVSQRYGRWNPERREVVGYSGE